VYQKQFPSCKIKGSLEPTEFGHMFSKGMIPKKCSEVNMQNLIMENVRLREKLNPYVLKLTVVVMRLLFLQNVNNVTI